jgi:uncharacterized membrane protein (UPF0136 family)
MHIHPPSDNTTALGTLTGTVFTVAAIIDTQDFMKTVILAVVGATVSFVVSLGLKWLRDFLRGPQEP